MPDRNLDRVQEALGELTKAQHNINELYYYKKHLNKPNHSVSACSSVCKKIDSLKNKHIEVVNSLLFYGNSYSGVDYSLATQNNPDYQGGMVKNEFSYVIAPEHQKSRWEKFRDQIILGEFSEDVTWDGVIGNITVSLVAGFFGVDAPLDIRDAAANFSKGEWGWALLDCVFLIPVIGAFKPAKYTDEVLYLAKHADKATYLAKYGDEAFYLTMHGDEVAYLTTRGKGLIDINGTIIKNSDGIIQSTYKIADNTFEYVDEIFSGVNNVDNIAVTLKNGDNLLWVTGKKSEFILDGNIFKKVNNVGEVEIVVNNVKVLPDYSYVRKSDAAQEVLRKAFNDTDRAVFLEDLTKNNLSDLKKIGLEDWEIDNMKKGIVPDGYEVHHKIPLSDGGNNDPSNLILINKSDHMIFSNYQMGFSNTTIFKEQGYMIVDWVIPEGKVYIP